MIAKNVDVSWYVHKVGYDTVTLSNYKMTQAQLTFSLEKYVHI